MEPETIDPNNNIVRNWLTGIGIGLLIIIGITFALHLSGTAAPAAGGTASTTATSTAATSTSASVPAGAFPTSHETPTMASMGEMALADNQRAGTSVMVHSLRLTSPSWVAVKAANGLILGAALFPADATEGSVSLLRATVAGERYEIVIYADAGDKTFDLHKDMLIINNDGTPVSTTFDAQ